MADVTHEDALRLAAELVGRALKETETRCALLAEFTGNCDQAGARTAAWSAAGSCAGAASFSRHSNARWAIPRPEHHWSRCQP
jgi:hypothetical protein